MTLDGFLEHRNDVGSRYGYGWQIYSRTHPVTKFRTRVINHGGAIDGFRAMENWLVDEVAFIIVLCNQGDAVGKTEVWNSVVNMSNELIHIVTGQPYRMPAKPRPSQEQRMYTMVEQKGVDEAIAWFKDKGKKAKWGGTNLVLAEKLIDDGRVKDGLALMEMEMELSPGKVWLLKRAAQAYLSNGRAERALSIVSEALELKSGDEQLAALKAEAERELHPHHPGTVSALGG